MTDRDEVQEPRPSFNPGSLPSWGEMMRQMVLSSMKATVTPEQAARVLDADWPVEAGDYLVGNPSLPVAISTLASPELAPALMRALPQAVSIAGKTETDNIGIEKVVKNIVSNASIRFLIVCGYDSIEMFPGQTLLCLSVSGMDDRHRVIGSPGKKPVLVNVTPEEVDHFRRQVTVIDLVGCQDVDRIAAAAADCLARTPGPFETPMSASKVKRVAAALPAKAHLDPAGFFVVHLDRSRGCLVLEHYENQGRLTTVIEGKDAASLYCTAIESSLVSRLDHAAYLGRELARAESSLVQGNPYVQDAAPSAQAH